MAKRKRRTFTPEFKTEVVLEALRGESPQVELCRRHNFSELHHSSSFIAGDNESEASAKVVTILIGWVE